MITEDFYTGYTEQPCNRCEGSGKKTDPTNADKVNPGPNDGQCSACKGEGVTRQGILRPDLQVVMDMETNRAIEARENTEISEIPEWMY
jgi:DnaJ-class molecular chaperone